MAIKATTPGPPARPRTRDYWLDCARRARATAARLGASESRAYMLSIAKNYELLAAHSEPDPEPAQLAFLAKQAEQRAASGERHVARQRALIATLARDGHDTSDAQDLLRTFEDAQVLHVEYRDRLRDEATKAVQASRAPVKPGLHRNRAPRHNPR